MRPLRAINGGRVARRRVTVREKHLSALVRWFLHWATSPTPCWTSGGILFLEWNLVTQLMYRLFQHLLAFWGWSMISNFAHKNTTSLFALLLLGFQILSPEKGGILMRQGRWCFLTSLTWRAPYVKCYLATGTRLIVNGIWMDICPLWSTL